MLTLFVCGLVIIVGVSVLWFVLSGTYHIFGLKKGFNLAMPGDTLWMYNASTGLITKHTIQEVTKVRGCIEIIILDAPIKRIEISPDYINSTSYKHNNIRIWL